MAGFGVDVLDPAVTPRRIAVLIDRVPPHARRGGEWWSVEAELLALLVDHVANLTWITARAAGAKNVPRPRPMARPGPVPRMGSRRNDPLTPGGQTPGGRGITEGGVKTASWADAIAVLGAIPGVVVEDG
jgi:hypothetical protein